MYAVTITMHSGAIVRATVSKHTLRFLNMKACSKLSWVKVRS
jgi:hypothetical protein